MTTKLMKMRNKMINDLTKLLGYIPLNKGIYLGNDVFLIGELDGSDKVYGFINDGELKVITRECGSGYPINQMDIEDLDYLFGSCISDRLSSKSYEIVEMDEV